MRHSIGAERERFHMTPPSGRHGIPKVASAGTRAPQTVEFPSRRLSQRVLASATDFSSFAPALAPAQTQPTREAHVRTVVNSLPGASDTMEGVIGHFFDAFNRRDLQQMADAVADDVEHCNLAYAKPYPKGKQAVLKFYESFIKAVPRSAQFIIEDTTGTNSPGSAIAVIWHLEIEGAPVPNSSGVSFFRLNSSNRISYVRESPEHFTKITNIALPTLSMISPLLSLAEPLLRGNNTSTPSSSPQEPIHAPTSHAPISPSNNINTESSSFHNTPTTSAVQNKSVAMRPLGKSSQVPEATTASQGDDRLQGYTMRPLVSTGDAGMAPVVHNGYAAPAHSAARDSVNAAVSPVATVAADPLVDVQPVSPDATPAVPRFAGLWQKDKTRCDRKGYECALDLMEVGGIQKATALGLEGMEVQFDADAGVFETFFLTPVPFFKVRERYVLGGAENNQSRRDLRAGQQVSKAWLQGAKVVTEMTWGPKKGGAGKEEFWVDENDQLNVKSTVSVNGQSSTTLQVYSRQEAGDVDSRYYAEKRVIPFGVDPNSISPGILNRILK